MFDQKTIDILKNGGIGIIPTDTLYGLVGRADLPETVERIYKVRKRNPDKPLIILSSSIKDLDRFGIQTNKELDRVTDKLWPGKVSIVLPADREGIEYITRGTNTLAIRIPDKKELQALLKETGPLVAPSANPEGKTPARNIEEARNYFGEDVDFYVDEGELNGESSTLVVLENSKPKVIREGAVKINEENF